MKKTAKRLLMCMLLVVFACTCSGCGKMTAEKVMEKFTENQVTMDNCEATMKMNMVMEASGESFEMNVDAAMQVIAKPDMKAKVAMSMDMGELGSYDMDTYIIKEGEQYYTYVNASDMWMKQAIDSEEIDEQLSTYSNQMNYDVYTKNMQNFVLEGEELVGEKETYKITGVVSGESLKEVMEQSGVSEYSATELEGIDFSQMGDLPVTLWVEKKTFHPAKISIDMAGMMANILAAAEEAEDEVSGVTIPACSIELEYISFDVQDIVLPEEAKDAVEMDADSTEE